MKKATIRREDLKPGECLCDHCTGKCCRYFSLAIPAPITWDGFDAVERYLADGRAVVYLEEGTTWYLLVATRCKYLARDNRCAIYLNRPKVCREYTTDDCEYDTEWTFRKLFEAPAQVREYAEALLPPRRVSRRPAETPGDCAVSFSLPIAPPTTRDDFDAIRWYLAHGDTRVTVEGRAWRLDVLRAGERPAPGPIDAKVFEGPEQLWEYAEAVLPPRRRNTTPGPTLPVVALP